MVGESLSGHARSQRLEIHTFGRFVVRYGTRVLSDETRRSRKLWRLFLYLLRNADREVPAETIAEYLWDEDYTNNPQAALYNLIYRLRQLFGRLSEPQVQIEYSQVGYSLQLSDTVWYDVREFLSLLQRATVLKDTDPSGAIESYWEALDLYDGHYLPGRSYELWVVAESRHYRRLYIDSLQHLLGLLRQPARYGDVVAVCEKALAIENFLDVEQLHYSYMEALAKEGRPEEALSHYQQISRLLYREYGRRPGQLLQGLQLMIKNHTPAMQNESSEGSLSELRGQLLAAVDQPGAYLCSRDVFRSLIEVESRQSGRSDRPSALGLFSIVAREGQIPQQAVLARAMSTLQKILIGNLRQGDAVTQWNGSRFLVLLPHCDAGLCRQCGARISKEFEHQLGGQGLSCLMQFEQI